MGGAAQPIRERVDQDLADLERVLTHELYSLKDAWTRWRGNVEMAQEIVDYFSGQDQVQQAATIDDLRRRGIDTCRDQVQRHLVACQKNFLQVSRKVNELRQTIAKVQVLRCYRIVYARHGIEEWYKANEVNA